MMVQLLAYHPIILLFMIILWLENQCKATPLKIFQDGKGPVKEGPRSPLESRLSKVRSRSGPGTFCGPRTQTSCRQGFREVVV